MDGMNEKNKSSGFFGGLNRSRGSTQELAIRITVFFLSFLFAGCHIAFGARPVAIAFLAVLPSHVWVALGGAVIGSLTLGEAGIVYALICAVVVFLRVVVSGGGRGQEGGKRSFSERLLLRVCASIIGGFVIAVYEALLSGLNKTTLLFGLCMILIPPLIVFVLSGLFDSGVTVDSLLVGGSGVFSTHRKNEGEKMRLLFFRISAGALLLLISLSLDRLEFLGISCAYIFASFATLLVAKRFGALYGAVCGFICAVGLSPIYAVSFALLGIASAFLFKLGLGYALAGGGAALSLWGAYAGGLVGFLTAFPEYILGAALAFPVLKKISAERTRGESEGVERSAQDMVGMVALAYQNKYVGGLDSLEEALVRLSAVISDFYRGSSTVRKEEIYDIIDEEAEGAMCDLMALCNEGAEREELIKNRDELCSLLMKKKRISPEELSLSEIAYPARESLARRINMRVGALEERRYKRRQSVSLADGFTVISKMINEARCIDESEKTMDASLSEQLSAAFCSAGFSDGVIRAFGERKKHIIAAGEDADGSKITSDALRADIERIANIRLGSAEYFRRGSSVLMECTAQRKYVIEYATATLAGGADEISGDTAVCFESGDDRFFAVISDGMGSGEVAMETSSFVTEFLRGALAFGYSKDTVLYLLNSIVRSRAEECSATVDLFEMDLITAEAQFVKCGAVSSYVKRDSSIFRIRSRTAPIGLMKTVDAERIKVEIKSGDYIIMASDGVSQTQEEAAWLVELLAKPAPQSLKEYAENIINTAKRQAPPKDDMTVVIAKINEIL